MKTLFGFSTAIAFALATAACSNDYAAAEPTTLEVTGRVDTQLRSLDNASAIALGSNGRTYSAYIQTNGSFRLSLPVGNVYRVIFANSTMSGELKTIGHLVNPTSTGRSDEIAVKEGGRLNIGAVRPAGSTTSAVKPACECDGTQDPPADKGDPTGDYDKGGYDKGGNDTDGYDKGEASKATDEDFAKDDDYSSNPKDGDKDRICDDSSDVELVADNAPGDRCAKSSSDKDAPKITKKSCSAPSAKGGTVEKPGGVEKPSGESCTCTAECGSGSACAASKCAPTDPSSTDPEPSSK